MHFLWPQMLWFLLAVPALVGGYAWMLRRRSRAAVRYADVGLVRAAMRGGAQARRHLPPLLLLLALVAAVFALARPTAVVTLPSEQQTIVLAMDVSLSMRATDVEPNRLVAAQTAAKSFIDQQPAGVRMAIVSFAGTASLVQPPTDNREDLKAAIDRFQLQRATAIGSGILLSLATIFPDADIDLSMASLGVQTAGALRAREKSAKGEKKEKKPPAPVQPGSYSSAVIVLLTDGRTTTGPDPLEAAHTAADRGVRVFTVGFGTPQGANVGFEGGWSIFMRFDEATLKSVADITKGEYFYAGSAEDLKKIYDSLTARLVLERKETEVGALFSALAALLAAVAGGLSVVWSNRLG